jgi:uncharacterized repeat protein (TIGR01451 family)
VAQNSYGTVYGQDATFTTLATNSNNSLAVSKKAINLTAGNLTWQTLANAKPLDTLSFAITLQANGQDIHNVTVQDVLPAGLVYKGNLTVNANLNSNGDIRSGINIGTIPNGQIVIIAYQAQVAGAENFNYGLTNVVNNTTITSWNGVSMSKNFSIITDTNGLYWIMFKDMSAGAYTAYVIHAPVIILFALCIRNVTLYPLLKFAAASLIAVPLCFFIGTLIRKLPLARNIL